MTQEKSTGISPSGTRCAANQRRPYPIICFVMAVFASACSLGRTAAPPAAASAAAAPSNRHIYVTAEGLPDACYHDLGAVGFVEPYFDSVIDSDHSKMAGRLRDVAVQKFPDRVDAVINVRTKQNSVGTQVAVAGDAVQLSQHETVECAERTAPGVLDKAALVAAGGMVGTLAGGLAGTAAGMGVTGAMGGAAAGMTAAGGYEIYEHVKNTRAQEAAINNRIQQQRNEIAQLREEVAKLVHQQCQEQELSAAACADRQQALEQVSATTVSSPAVPNGAAADATKFQVLNKIQEQQETIDRLKAEVTRLHQQMHLQ